MQKYIKDQFKKQNKQNIQEIKSLIEQTKKNDI